MMMIKTLSKRIAAPLLLASALPATAQVSLDISTHKVYRQDKSPIRYTGGSFVVRLDDGDIASIGGCNWIRYYPPGYFLGTCSEGTTAMLSDGAYGEANVNFPYLLVTAIQPAIAIAPRAPRAIQLRSAPASELPRPLGGFTDDSLAVYYNLHTTTVREYVLTGYDMERTYGRRQRGRFEKEIVPGVYHYSFPRLNNPDRPAPITATIYPIIEGKAKINNKTVGFEFTNVNGNKFTKDGRVKFGYRIPNVIQWKPLPPSVVFAATDDLYFSLRELRNPRNTNSPAVRGRAIFPPYVNNQDPRVQLPSPYQTSFTTPPLLDSGTQGVIEVELGRAFQTGAVTYDFSTRRFQMPFEVIDYYTEYQGLVFGPRDKNTKILQDSDNDGYNNLLEWILESDASDSGSVPAAPVPALVEEGVDPFFGIADEQYFGFNVELKLGTRPLVEYTLQRSTNGGRTWQTFESDENWYVGRPTQYVNGALRTQIIVRSLTEDDDNVPNQPLGTENDIYRLKVTLARKNNNN